MLIRNLNFNDVAESLVNETVDQAIHTESVIYDKYTKFIETQKNFNRTLQPLQKVMFDKGLKLRKPVFNSRKGRVAFLLLTFSKLAHVDVLATYINRAKAIKPYVYYLHDTESKVFTSVFKCPVIHLPGTSEALTKDLRESLLKNQIDTLVLVSCPTFASLLSGLRPCKNIVWWSMKYHNLNIPQLDTYISNNKNFYGEWKGPNNRTWLNARGAMEDLVTPESIAEGKAIQERRFRGKLVLGVIGREEKLNNKEYAEIVVKLLSKYPNAVFLYTGKLQPMALSHALNTYGVANRAQYLQWVDPKVWSSVIDVYLDSFPLPSGQTFCQAALAGCAIVSMIDTQESKSASIAQKGYEWSDFIAPGCSRTPGEYLGEAIKVIENSVTRAINNDFWKNYVMTEMMNTERFAEDMDNIFKEEGYGCTVD